jgi:hypothetical protein
MENLESFIRRMAQSECMMDDPEFNVQDHCGGNYDDAYSLGQDDGYAMLAREILKRFFDDTTPN